MRSEGRRIDAVVIREDGGARSWAAAFRIAMALLRRGWIVRRMGSVSPHEQAAPPGSFVVTSPGGGADRVAALRETLASQLASPEGTTGRSGVEVVQASLPYTLESQPSLRVPRVAVYGVAGAPYHYLDIFSQAGFDVVPIGADEIRRGELDRFDVVAVPGGGWEHMNGQLRRLGGEGAASIRRFVESGGTYLSSCAGTYNVLEIDPKFRDGWNPAHDELPKLSARSWLTDPNQPWGLRSPGIGVIQAELGSEDHPLAIGLRSPIDVVYYNGPILEATGDHLRPLLVCRAPDGGRFTPSEAFVRPLAPEGGTTAMEQACDLGLLGGAFQRIGEGRVVGFGLHPEFGPDPDMMAWGRPALLLANAALLAATSPSPKSRPVAAYGPRSGSEVPAMGSDVRDACTRLAEAFDALRRLPVEPLPEWLAPEARPRAAFGRDAVALWRESTEAARDIALGLGKGIERWQATYDELASDDDLSSSGRLDVELAHRLVAAAPLEPDQDLGFKGVAALLDEIRSLIDTLTAGGETGRYRAVAMSYLSAAGLMVDARLLLDAALALLARARLESGLPRAT